MEQLPAIGWTDLVTKNDLRLELAALESRIDAKLEHELREQANRFLAWMTAIFTIFGILLGLLVTLVG
jgi:hypothetical protein